MENASKQVPQTPIDRAKFDVHPDVDPRFTTRVLTPRMRRMVTTYVRTGNYSEAARASGYTPQTVSKMLRENDLVRKAVGELVDQAAIVAGVSLERVLQEYARLAFSDVGELLDVIEASGNSDDAIALLKDLPADTTAAISTVTYERKHAEGDAGAYIDGKLTLKMHDKKTALQDLARMLSLFNDRLTIEDNTAFGDRLAAAVTRIETLAAKATPDDPEAQGTEDTSEG